MFACNEEKKRNTSETRNETKRQQTIISTPFALNKAHQCDLELKNNKKKVDFQYKRIFLKQTRRKK